MTSNTVDIVPPSSVSDEAGWPSRLIAVSHGVNDLFSGSLAMIMVAQDEALGLTDSQIGAVPSLLLAVSVLQPFFGFTADKYRQSYLMLGGSVITAIGMLICALAPSYSIILLGALVGGLGNAMFHPIGLASARAFAKSKSNSGRSMALFMFGGNGAFAFSPTITAFILFYFGLSGFPLLALVAIFVVPFILYRLRPLILDRGIASAKKETKEIKLNAKGGVQWTRRIIIMLIAYLTVVLLRGTMQQSFTTFLPEFYTEQDQTIIYAGLATSALLLPQAIGSYIGAALSDYVARRTILVVSILSMTPLSLLMLQADGVWIFVFSIILGLMINANWPLLLMIGQEVLPGGAVGASGFAFGWGFVASATGSFLVGLLADEVGLQSALETMSFAPLLAVGLIFLLPREEREEKD